MKQKVSSIEYERPIVILLQDTGLGTSEFAARTAYDSFEASENQIVKIANEYANKEKGIAQVTKDSLNSIEHSGLLDDLAWTYFHHSVLEHAVLTYLIKGTSRGVLQELARHRIASYTVRSTRYTMNSVINAFNACMFARNDEERMEWFQEIMTKEDLLVTSDINYQLIEWGSVFQKLRFQREEMATEDWEKLTIPKKSTIDFLSHNDPVTVFNELESLPKKRNLGDSFKHIVTDNWKVDLVMTINLRSLKNFMDLRDSGAAWFQIRWLAEEMKEVTPKKYLKLIRKKMKG